QRWCRRDLHNRLVRRRDRRHRAARAAEAARAFAQRHLPRGTKQRRPRGKAARRNRHGPAQLIQSAAKKPSLSP
ncbi:hypothetical protein IscW_ISCW003742, partial [Ixodes scapularis]